jgi:hypothetical protein
MDFEAFSNVSLIFLFAFSSDLNGAKSTNNYIDYYLSEYEK